MKNKIAIASAFIAASSFSTAEIVINDFLSFEGFIDASYSTYQGEVDIDNGGPNFDESGNSFGIDQVEISWLFDFDPVTAQIDLEYEESNGSMEVEQAFVTYHFDNGGALTAGRFASMLGFEAFEPTGLYQYSFAYGLPLTLTDTISGIVPAVISDEVDSALNRVVATIFPVGPRYNQGVKYTYETDTSFFGVSILDGISGYSGRFGGDSSTDGTAPESGGYGAELAAAFYFDNGVSYFAGLAYENGDGYNFLPAASLLGATIGTGDTETWIFNTYVTLETGAWLFAAEFNYASNEWDDLFGASGVDLEVDSITALIMANFAYSDQASITGRISYMNADGDVGGLGGDTDFDLDSLKYTLAHNYAFTDNLLLVTELSYTDGDADADILGNDLGADFSELSAAVELIFTF